MNKQKESEVDTQPLEVPIPEQSPEPANPGEQLPDINVGIDAEMPQNKRPENALIVTEEAGVQLDIESGGVKQKYPSGNRPLRRLFGLRSKRKY